MHVIGGRLSRLCKLLPVCIHVCIYVCMYICIYVCVHIRMYVCMLYVCITYVCIYILRPNYTTHAIRMYVVTFCNEILSQHMSRHAFDHGLEYKILYR